MAAWIAQHRKAIAGVVGFLGAFLTFLSAQADLGSVSKYAGIILAAGGAFGVWKVRNDHPADNDPAAAGAASPGHPRGS